MLVRILGSAAGGRFPQWNCGCPNCQAVRAGDPALSSRTQDSIAVSSDGERWFVFNIPADILEQIARTPALHPRGPRHTPIEGVFIGNGDLDHVLGLFCVRESQPLALYATDRVRADLERNVMAKTLQRFDGHTRFHRLAPAQPCSLCYGDGTASGLTVTPLAAAGKRPLHLMDSGSASDEDNVAFQITDNQTGRTCLYASAVGDLGSPGQDGLRDAMARADCLLMDGTFFSEDELIRLELGDKRAADMAHLPIGGPEGSLAQLASLPCERRIFTHINNTNPILRSDSPERRAVEEAGWEVALDDMVIEL